MARRCAWSRAVGILLTVLLHAGPSAADPVRNGFVLEPVSIPASGILAGGLPRDGIPALHRPVTLTAAQADWNDDELVLGVIVGSEACAYPVAILNWHERVNAEGSHKHAKHPCSSLFM